MGREYLQKKIQEARNAADFLTPKGTTK